MECHSPRATQLINKTNQFNLTTRRLTESEVQALAADPTVCTLTVRLADRFGDHGLVSVLIASQRGQCRGDRRLAHELPGSEARCRTHAPERLADWAGEHGVSVLRARFLSTGRNELVRNLLDDLGFERCSESEQVTTGYRLGL